MPGRSTGRGATVVDLDAYAEQVATTDGRVPGERGRQTRLRLLEATTELLTTTSWRSVKVTDIARRANTSPATFYQYFGNVEEAIRVLAEGMVDEAAQLSELVGGDWSEDASWTTAMAVTEGFLGYWEDNRAVFRVVDLATEEGRRPAARHPCPALNAVTVALAQVIAHASPSPDGRAGRGDLLARRRRPRWPWPARWWPCSPACRRTATASEFWGIRTRNLIDTQARILHWSVTGRQAPPAEIPPRESTRPRTGPALGGATARAATEPP